MKNNKIKAAIIGLSAVTALFCAVALAACKNNESAKLSVPQNLRMENDYLVWDEVKGANGYTVDVNGVEYPADTNVLDIMTITNAPATYTFKVLTEGETRIDYSDWSEEIEYKVETPKNLVYNLLDDGTYEVLAENDFAARKELTGKLIVPSVTDSGGRVTAIAKGGFSYCANITSVYIPDEIEKVGESTFENCTSLSRVRLSNALTQMSTYMFSNCRALKEFVVPDGITALSGGTFENCISLEKIDLPDGLSFIGSGEFSVCTSLKSLIIPSAVKGIEDDHVNFSGAFIKNCDSLTHLEIKGGENEKYKSEGNCIIRKSDNALVCGCNGSAIPDYVTKIGRSAFYYCRTFKEINLPASIKEIEERAFYHCENLRSINLPEGLITVETRAFECCMSLKSAHVSSTVEKWGVNIRHWSHYQKVFLRCDSLREITVSENNPYFKSDMNCIINCETNELIEGCTGSTIPDYITRIGKYAFSLCYKLEEITIPYGVTEIGKYAFLGCRNLREAYIPISVIHMDNPFADSCIASITLPDGVNALHLSGYYNDIITNVIKYDGNYPYVYSVKRLSGHGFDKYNFKGLIAPVRKGYTFLGWTRVEGATAPEIPVETLYFEHSYDPKYHYDSDLHGHSVAVTKCPKEYDVRDDLNFYAVWQKNN